MALRVSDTILKQGLAILCHCFMQFVQGVRAIVSTGDDSIKHPRLKRMPCQVRARSTCTSTTPIKTAAC